MIPKKELKKQVKALILIDAKRLKEKYGTISENIKGVQKILTIKEIYQLNKLKDFFLITVSDSSTSPKIQYFLSIMLASQSSDFLVNIAKSIIKQEKTGFRLIQFLLHPKSLRTNLLCLLDLNDPKELDTLIEKLEKVRKLFKERIDNLINAK